MPEITLELLFRVRGYPQGPDVDDLGVEECLRVGFHIGYQGTDQILRLSAAGRDKDPVAAMNIAEDLLLGVELIRISPPHIIQEIIVPHVRIHCAVL